MYRMYDTALLGRFGERRTFHGLGIRNRDIVATVLLISHVPGLGLEELAEGLRMARRKFQGQLRILRH